MLQSPQSSTARFSLVRRDLAILLFTVVSCAVPFLSQPFHMDDNFYMDMARNARAKPFFPNDTPYVFEGRFLADMGSHSHPPLQTYFLALLQWLAGEGAGKEWIYHIAALIFPITAVIAFYFLAARIVQRPLWPSVVLACSPLFLVMQHNLMTDLPTFAFWLAAITCFVWAEDFRSGRLYAASSVFQFAAMFTSYQAAVLAPLLGFYHFRRRGGINGWLALVAAPALMTAWLGVSSAHYHRFLLADTFGYVQSRDSATLLALGSKLLAALEYQGWLILFPLFFLYVFARGLKGRLLGLALVASIYLAQVAVPQYRLTDQVIFVLGLVTGTFVLGQMGVFLAQSMRGRRPADGPDPLEGEFLGLWYFLVLGYSVLILTEGSARYILPLVPPVLVGFFRQLEDLEVTEYRRQPRPLLSSAMVASGSLVVTLAWGLVLSHADQEFASIYPRAAREFSKITRGMDSYFAGEWGFRYYFSQAGVRQLPVDETSVAGGSWLARPRLALRYEVPAGLQSMTMPVQTLAYDVGTPIRTLDWRVPAGLYSTGWGLIPFSISRKSLELVEISQVNFFVERLPWATVETEGHELPWPGYATIQGTSPLAILARAGTRISFPWTAPEPLRLELKTGILPQSVTEGSSATFEFLVRQVDKRGNTLTQFAKILAPGQRKEDLRWHSVPLLMHGARQGAGALELCFLSDDKDSSAVGAFAEGFLRAPD